MVTDRTDETLAGSRTASEDYAEGHAEGCAVVLALMMRGYGAAEIYGELEDDRLFQALKRRGWLASSLAVVRAE